MSVLNTRNVVFATCGAVLGCASAYAYGGANQLVALAGAVGAVALPVICEAIYQSIPESGFKPFDLDITPYRYLGNIDNRSLLAHKALGNEDVCVYLRKMDLAEFELIKKEHDVTKKAWDLSGPATTGGIISAITGVGVVIFAEVVAFVPTLLATVGAGLFGGCTHAFANVNTTKNMMSRGRAGRLACKISNISAKISKKENKVNYPREYTQLHLALGFFKRNLQAYESYKRRNFPEVPIEKPSRFRVDYYYTLDNVSRAHFAWR